MFFAEMCAAGFIAFQGVCAHQLSEFQKICDASSAFERLVKISIVPWDPHIVPELFAKFGNFSQRLTQSFFVARHPAFVPEKQTKLAMERIERTCPVDLEEFLNPGTNVFFRALELGRIRRWPFSHLASEIIRQCAGQNEIKIGQSLHESAGPEPVRAMIGKIRFTDYKQTGHVAH